MEQPKGELDTVQFWQEQNRRINADLGRVERERDEARWLAQEYYHHIRQMAGECQWEKHWASDVNYYQWLTVPEKPR